MFRGCCARFELAEDRFFEGVACRVVGEFGRREFERLAGGLREEEAADGLPAAVGEQVVPGNRAASMSAQANWRVPFAHGRWSGRCRRS